MKTQTQQQTTKKQKLDYIKSKKPVRSVYFKSIVSANTIDDNGDPTGALAAYGNIDNDRDRLFTGCAAKSIQERGPNSATARKIAYLAYHDQSLPLGQFTELTETTTFLNYKAKFDKIPFVKQTIIPQLKSGTLNQHSIGFNYVWEKCEFNEEEDCLDVHEIDLFEGSIVTLGANENTPFGGFKKAFENTDMYGELAHRANIILKKMPDYKNEIELRGILQKYQSLLDVAAEEIKNFTAKKTIKKPKRIDYLSIAKHLNSL